MSSEMLILIGTLSASFLGFAATLAATWLTKQSEERKHLREIALQAALANWKQDWEVGLARKQAATIPPLDVYIVHMLKLSEIMLKKGLTATEIEAHLKSVDETTGVVMRYKRDQRPSLEEKV